MIPTSSLPKLDELYTFIDPSGHNTHIAVTPLRAWCHEHGFTHRRRVPVEPSLLQTFARDNCISPRRLNQLRDRYLKPSDVEPIIIAALEPFVIRHNNIHVGDVMLVDGHHRYTMFALAGLPLINSFLLEPQWWKPFVIDSQGLDLTQEQLKQIDPSLYRDHR